MQYLTEVRKTKAFVGEKVELKLLARNTSENNWVAINTDQIVTVSDTNLTKDLKDGQLTLADLTGNNNEVKSIQDASRRLVQTLQNFGRLQEKFRQGEEEIEQWKQSLTFQTQELQRRELEVEDREKELERSEARKEEIDAQIEQFDREKAEIERIRKLNQEKEQEFALRATALSSEQAQELRDLVKELSGSFMSVDSIHAKINACIETIYQRQEMMNEFWRDLESQRPRVTQSQQEVDAARRHLEKLQQEWQQTQMMVSEAQAELKLRKEQLQLQENVAQVLRTSAHSQEELFQQATGALAQVSGAGELLPPEEVKRLEEVAIEDLEMIVANSEAELQKMVNFVNAQEDELAALEGDIAELSEKITQANQFDKIELESEKEFTDEQYQMLEETLQGQRRSLQEKEFMLAQQRQILDKRMGGATNDPIDLFRPIVQELGSLRHQGKEALEHVQHQIELARSVVQQQQELMNDQKLSQQKKLQELRIAEEQLFDRVKLQAETEGTLNSLEKILRPVQDIIDALRPNLEAARSDLAQASSGQAAQTVLQRLEQKIAALIDSDTPNW